MYEKVTEKKTCESRAPAKQVGVLKRILALFHKLPLKSPTKLGAAVFALVVLHFVAQFVFFQDEKKAIQIETESNFEIQKQDETKPAEAIKTPTVLTPAKQEPEIESVTPTRAVESLKKKEPPRETDAERLRRAEKILTGI